ncbi:hypothetical protein N7454_008550 [Penicillium verhagenii]|nr:hypothetical protein N7454_008550 [Penicillium verhagenii]
MSSEHSQSNLQDHSSERNTLDLSKDPALQQQFGLLSNSVEPVQPPAFQQGVFDNSASSWSFITSPVPALETGSLSSSAPYFSPPQDSTIALHSNPLPQSLYDQDSSYSEHSYSEPSYSTPSHFEQFSEQSIQLSIEQENHEDRLPTEHPRGLGITTDPMSVASEAYFAGPMQPNSSHYGWPNRPYQPLQPSSGNMYQQFPPPQSYPSSCFPPAYGSHTTGPISGYHESHASPSYLPGPPGSARQNHSRSPSIARPFPPHSAAGVAEQPLMNSSPPYMINQPAYYLPEAPSIP